MRSRCPTVIVSLPAAAVSASSGRCASTGSSRLSAPSPSSMPTASDVTVFDTENTSRRMSAIRRRSPRGPPSATTSMASTRWSARRGSGPGRGRPARAGRPAGRLLLRGTVLPGPGGVLVRPRGARSTETSQVTCPAASARACSAVMIARQVPSRCQRRNSPYADCHGPYAVGTSRHGDPVRVRQRIPLTSCRLAHFGGPPPSCPGAAGAPARTTRNRPGHGARPQVG